MGSFLTVDKHLSNLEDVLELNPRLLAQTKFEANLSPDITHHLKVWKFFEEDAKSRAINTLPVQLATLTSAALPLTDSDCFLVLLIHTAEAARSTKPIPQCLSTTFDALSGSMTPRGLRTSVCGSHSDSTNLAYTMYIYCGKKAGQGLRHHVFSKCFELERLLNGCEQLLSILFSGGVIRNKKLQKGSLVHVSREEDALATLANFVGEIDLVNVMCSRQQASIRNLLGMPAKPLKRVVGTAGGFINSIKKNIPVASQSPPQQPPASVAPPVNTVTPVAPAPPNKIKTPILNLAIKPFEPAKFQDVEQQFKNGIIKPDLRDTARHELKMQYFQKECTQILDGLYVSGQKVAQDYETLQKYGIKCIVNCAADYCQNWFQSKGLQYIAFFLKDSQIQSIQCLFYRVIDFIQTSIKNNKKVLIHCIQGISRSVTMVIAYVMFIMKYDYKQAEAFVKKKRAVASPNNGFMVELIQFHKRLYEDFDSLPSPRIFLVSSHCKETPDVITARLLKHPVYDKRRNIGLDCRALYIIVQRDTVYVWIGSKCQDERLERYWKYAQEYIKKLQIYERASKNVKTISQGAEGLNFFSDIWGLQAVPELYENPEYNNLFVPLDQQSEPIRPGANRKLFNNDGQQQQKIKYKLFIHPDTGRGLGVFEMDDLSGLSVIFKDSKQDLEIYAWKSRDSMIGEEQQRQFIDTLLRKYYSHIDARNTEVFSEQEGRESPEFLQCFQ